MVRKMLSLAAGATVIAVATAGCGASAAAQGNTGAQGAPVKHIECSQATSYASLRQLRRAATSVAVFRLAGGTRVRMIGGIPFTIATVRVLEPLQGKRLPAQFGLRQLGGPGFVADQGSGCAPLVSRRDVYVAYLAPFRLRRGGPRVTNQYVVVGGAQGLFEHAGPVVPANEASRSFARVGQEPGSSLPAQISISQARHS
jgi:hypothetical protein